MALIAVLCLPRSLSLPRQFDAMHLQTEQRCDRAQLHAHLLGGGLLLGSSHSLGHCCLALGSVLSLALLRCCRLPCSCRAEIGWYQQVCRGASKDAEHFAVL